MFAFTVTNQVVNTAQEVVLPYIFRAIERYRSETEWNPFGTKTPTESESGVPEPKKKTPQRKMTESEMMELTMEREWETKLLQEVKKNALLPDYTLFSKCTKKLSRI